MASSIPPSVSPTAAASLSSSSSSSLRSLPPPRSTSLRASASSRTSLTSRSTVESVLRLLLTLLIAVPIVLLALRDVRHLTQLYLWRQRTVSRAVLFLHWRSKTFHVEAQQVDHVVPWGLAVLAIGALAVGARPGRRAIVPRVAVLAVMGLALLLWTYTDATSIYAQLRPLFTGAVYHQMESILPRPDALAIISLATSLQSRAGQANETDHDWLHLYTAAHGPKVWLLNPDVDVPFPWSFVTLFLVLLAASSLRHRYTVHLSRGRWRFVPRVPDPEYADGDDSWENVTDAPTAEEVAEKVGGKGGDGGGDDDDDDAQRRAFVATPPLHRFPLKHPTEAQAAAGRTFHARRATRRMVQRAVFLVLVLVVLGIDAIGFFSVRSLSARVASGDFVPTHVFLVVDVAPLEGSAAEVQGRLEEVGRALAGGGTGKAAGAAAAAEGPQLPPKFPMRPIPYIREWKPEYPLPTITFFIIIGLIHLALPPFTTPRARLLIHEDRLVAIPLTYPTVHHTLPFSAVTGIDLRSEDSPHGATVLRYRRFGSQSSRNRARRSPSPSADGLATPEPYRRRARRVRGYLYAGVGDVGVGAAEDLCVVVVRTEKGFADGDWEVQVQGLDVVSLRDLLTDAVGRYKEMVGVDAVA